MSAQKGIMDEEGLFGLDRLESVGCVDSPGQEWQVEDRQQLGAVSQKHLLCTRKEVFRHDEC
eukprot:1192270-Prorocentrum_minimum.AAC.13